MEMAVEWKRAPVRRQVSVEREAASTAAELQIWPQRSHSGNVEQRFSAGISRRDDSFTFLDCIDPVGRGNRDLLFCTARPVNLHPVHFRRCSKTKVQTLVGTRCVAPSAEDVSALPRASCCDKYLGSNRITWTLGASHQFQCDPMIRILDYVA